MNNHILTTVAKISNLEEQMICMKYHIYQKKTEHLIFYLEEDLSYMDKYDKELRKMFGKSESLTDEYIIKKNEIDTIKDVEGITSLEKEYKNLKEHLKDGNRYFDSLLENEYNSMVHMLENFHL